MRAAARAGSRRSAHAPVRESLRGASVRLSPGKERPYSLAYTDIGSWRMGGNSHLTRTAAIRACERLAAECDREQSLEDPQDS